MIENNQYLLQSLKKNVISPFQFAQNSIKNTWQSLNFDRLLLSIILIELLLGGNGYLVEIAGIRLRVLMYIFCMGWVAVKLLNESNEKLPRLVTGFSFCFAILTIFGTLIGLLNGASLAAIASELKGMMYFPMFLFFAVTIKDQEDIDLIAYLIIFCGLIQSVLYLSVLVVMKLGFISYSDVYLFLKKSDEFIFRHSPSQNFFVGFFYKGFFYLGIATIFLLFHPKEKKYGIGLAVITMTALALTLTRGVILATTLSLLLEIFLTLKKRRIFLIYIAIILAFASFLLYYGLRTEANLTSDRKEAVLASVVAMRPTDNIRIHDLQYVVQQINPRMILFGKGIGSPLGGRERIEMVFMEIFYKQGILGILFWFSLIATNFFLFRKIKKDRRSEVLPFFLSPIFVYLASMTNNFLTGSIGMSIIFICFVVLSRFSEKFQTHEINQRK